VRFRILLLRGLLGGVLGGVVWACLLIFMKLDHFGSTWGQWLFIEMIFGVPLGIFLGGLSATLTWLIYRISGLNLGLPIRAILGMLLALTLWFIFWLLTDRTGLIPTPWQEDLVDAVRFAAALGGVAAIVVGKQRYEEKAMDRKQQNELTEPRGNMTTP